MWALWLYRFVLSRLARPIVNDFTTTTSVVVPSYHEDPDILMRCLESWREQDPDEILIVLDVADTEAYERLVALDDPRIHAILFKHAGKRSALGVGIRAATSDILVLTDSDTSWEPGLLKAVQHPFARPDGRGGQHPAERARAHDQRLAPGRGLAGQSAVLRLRAGDGPGRRGRLRLRPDRRLPPQRRAAGAGQPGERVLPRPALCLR